MSPWAFNDSNRGKSYSRQLKLTFKRYEAGQCIECRLGSPVLPMVNGKRRVRCERHLARQRRGKG